MPIRHDEKANLVIEQLKEHLEISRAENAELRMRKAELVNQNMDMYMGEKRSKWSKLILEDYQQLIFG